MLASFLSSEKIVTATSTMMTFLLKQQLPWTYAKKYFPDDQHVFIYDNATTHLKRADNALSAHKMPKNTPKPGTNWGIEVKKCKPDGQIEHGSNGKPLKIKVKMGHGFFSNGQPQDFYFPEGHECAGVFKRMVVILQERGYTWAKDLKEECPKFNCPPDAKFCCCRCILYTEPDFVDVNHSSKNTVQRGGSR